MREQEPVPLYAQRMIQREEAEPLWQTIQVAAWFWKRKRIDPRNPEQVATGEAVGALERIWEAYTAACEFANAQREVLQSQAALIAQQRQVIGRLEETLAEERDRESRLLLRQPTSVRRN